MDETAVWSDMMGNTTASTTSTKDMPFPSTGNDEVSQ